MAVIYYVGPREAEAAAGMKAQHGARARLSRWDSGPRRVGIMWPTQKVDLRVRDTRPSFGL